MISSFNKNPDQKPRLLTQQDVWQETREIHDLPQPHLLALYLNHNFQLLTKKILSLEPPLKTEITLQEILTPALSLPATFLILVRNQPQEENRPKPSPTDINLTYQVSQLANSLGITLLDYLVVSKTGFTACPLPVSITTKPSSAS